MDTITSAPGTAATGSCPGSCPGSPYIEAPLSLTDLPDDLLRLILKPQHRGAARACRQLRTLTLATVHTRCIRYSGEHCLDQGLACAAALPSLTQLSISVERDDLHTAVTTCHPLTQCMGIEVSRDDVHDAVTSCAPLSRLTHLTKLEIARPHAACRSVCPLPHMHLDANHSDS
jgi:hypothetical protein